MVFLPILQTFSSQTAQVKQLKLVFFLVLKFTFYLNFQAVLFLLSISQPGSDQVGVMVPIPQYPLYSATNAEYNVHQIDYYLDEENNWNLDIAELERALSGAKENCKPRALVVINPGNPTGQVLSRSCMEVKC